MATIEEIRGDINAQLPFGIDPVDVPVLLAYSTSKGEWLVWCGYCQHWHTHGPYSGHRRAHCPPRLSPWETTMQPSPYVRTGYALKYGGPLTQEVRDQTERLYGTLGVRARYLILERDGFRCQICGRTAQDGIKLEVDHKMPRAKGGSNAPENLWTLCDDCNRGKSTNEVI